MLCKKKKVFKKEISNWDVSDTETTKDFIRFFANTVFFEDKVFQKFIIENLIGMGIFLRQSFHFIIGDAC